MQQAAVPNTRSPVVFAKTRHCASDTDVTGVAAVSGDLRVVSSTEFERRAALNDKAMLLIELGAFADSNSAVGTNCISPFRAPYRQLQPARVYPTVANFAKRSTVMRLVISSAALNLLQ
jgi:hypothetical protein